MDNLIFGRLPDNQAVLICIAPYKELRSNVAAPQFIELQNPVMKFMLDLSAIIVTIDSKTSTTKP